MTPLAPTPVLGGRPRRAGAWLRRRAALADLFGGMNSLVIAAAVVAVALLLIAALAPWIAPFDPNQQTLLARLRPPMVSCAPTRTICWAPINSDATF